MYDHVGLRIALIGAGRAGASLGRALHAVGYSIASIWSRTSERAADLALATGAHIATTPVEAVRHADLALLAVVDSQITPLCELIAAAGPPAAPCSIVHLSGANGAAVLYPLSTIGYTTGACHPLQTFADQQSPILSGTVFAIEAKEPLNTTLTTMARRLGGVPLALDPADRPLYHAAATITANYTITLLSQAVDLLARCGLTPEASLSALLPLLRGALDNTSRVGLPEALTGPIVRGDVDTVARHVSMLAARAPAVLATYRALGEATVRLAAERDTNPQQLAAIAALLRSQPDTQGSGHANDNS